MGRRKRGYWGSGCTVEGAAVEQNREPIVNSHLPFGGAVPRGEKMYWDTMFSLQQPNKQTTDKHETD